MCNIRKQSIAEYLEDCYLKQMPFYMLILPIIYDCNCFEIFHIYTKVKDF